MNAKNPVPGLLLGFGVLLASCGGGDGTGGGSQAGAPSQPALPVPTGSLKVTVTDPDGRLLEGATVSLELNRGSPVEKKTDQSGQAIFSAVPERALVNVNHPLGYGRVDVSVAQSGTTMSSVVLDPESGSPLALFPATVSRASLSADRSELELHLILAGSARTAYPFYVWAEQDFPDPEVIQPGEVLRLGPILRFGDCTFQAKVWKARPGGMPDCYRKPYPSTRRVAQRDYAVISVQYEYQIAGKPLPATGPGPRSTLLLLDQGERALQNLDATRLDPAYDRVHAAYMQNFTARHFIDLAIDEPQSNQVAIAGFAGSGAGATTLPLLPSLPLWSTTFSSDRTSLKNAAHDLESRFGGTSPVIAALQSAMAFTAEQVSPSSQRAVVALLGGIDDSGLTEQQRSAGLSALRGLREGAAIQTVLVAPQEVVMRQGWDLVEGKQSTGLADIAAQVTAPLIFNPDTWPASGLYAPSLLAADIVAGKALPTIDVVYRLQANQPGGFPPGSTIADTLVLVAGDPDWGYWEVPMPFTFEVP